MPAKSGWHRSEGLILTRAHLDCAKKQVVAGDSHMPGLWKTVARRSDKYLHEGALSVTQKSRRPPSGDLHDYMSVGTYWWPNPGTPDGLPYVRRDGEINPEFKNSDVDRIKTLCTRTLHLAVAGHLSGHARYAQKAGSLVRHWFIEPETRMNPHLRYAQHIPGVNEGRSLGIIDFKSVRQMLDAVCLLPDDAWSDADDSALRAWMQEYLDWLLHSDFGAKERARPNNHGTWYDAQTMAVALYTGDIGTAQAIGERGKSRIATQLTPAGEQPLELARSRPVTYCMMNLEGLFDIASMAEKIGIDLWRYESTDGKSLERAIEWLAPYIDGGASYSKKDIIAPRPDLYVSVLNRTVNKYGSRFLPGFTKFIRASKSVDGLVFPILNILEDTVKPEAKGTAEKSKVAAHWDSVKRPRGTKWWENDLIIRHINRIVSGADRPGMSAGAAHWLKEKTGGRTFRHGVSVGCGSGGKEMALVEKGVVERFTLFELSPERIRKGRALAKKKGLEDKVQFVLGDAFDSESRGRYDFVHWNNALHHMFDVEQAVNWSAAALEEGGYFFMDDFVGPARFQWGEATLELGARIRTALPERYRRIANSDKLLPAKPASPDRKRLVEKDPSEAVQSEKIIAALFEAFDKVEVRRTGGAVYNVAINNMIHNFDLNDDKDRALMDLMMIIDELCIDHPRYENHYAVALAVK